MTIIILQLLFILLYLIILVFLIYSLYAVVRGAPFVPISKNHLRSMIKMANLKPSQTLMDLGSGDGRIVIAAAKTDAKCIGIEINPLLYWWSKLKTKKLGLENVEIRRQDLWKTDLSQVDVLTLFFINTKMKKLKQKIKKEMKPGSRVLSYAFKFPDWEFGEKHDKIYLYINK